MSAILTPYTIWKFRGVSLPQSVTVARITEPTEHEHEYQQVIGRTMAYTPTDALKKWGAK